MDRRTRRTEEDGVDTELKTKNPHVNVGKISGFGQLPLFVVGSQKCATTAANKNF